MRSWGREQVYPHICGRPSAGGSASTIDTRNHEDVYKMTQGSIGCICPRIISSKITTSSPPPSLPPSLPLLSSPHRIRPYGTATHACLQVRARDAPSWPQHCRADPGSASATHRTAISRMSQHVSDASTRRRSHVDMHLSIPPPPPPPPRKKNPPHPPNKSPLHKRKENLSDTQIRTAVASEHCVYGSHAK